MVDVIQGDGDVSTEASSLFEFVADSCTCDNFLLLVDIVVEIWYFVVDDCSFVHLQSVSIYFDILCGCDFYVENGKDCYY